MEKVEAITQNLLLSDQQLERICSTLIHEFNRGLQRETHVEADVKMWPTHLKLGPSYECQMLEKQFREPDVGKFLALDLGGTNFRVVLIELEDANSEFHMDSETFAIPQHIMLGTGEQLFDHIAECLSKFIEKRPKLKGHRLPLGFTFSFPCRQEGLRRAKLISWTKGFKCSGVEGRDVVELLREALVRRPDVDIEVMAVVNDTTGTLMSCAFNNRDCRVGLIVGTGTNACYMETLDQVHLAHQNQQHQQQNPSMTTLTQHQHQVDPEEKMVDDAIHGQIPHHSQQIVVNTEWGAFGDNGCLDFIRTQWDQQIDMGSVNCGKQRFEKMISGMYIGELVRLILVDLATNHKLLFTDCEQIQSESHSRSSSFNDDSNDGNDDELEREKLFKQRHHRMFNAYDFNTKYVSMIESDAPDQFVKTRHALSEAFEIHWATDLDCRIVQLVCTRVSTRAAHLVSAAVAALLNKMRRPYTTVGVDGSVFRYHPHFHRLMKLKTKELTKPDYQFELEFSEDGSGRGAALVAAVACKQRRISRELISQQAQQQTVGC